MPSIPGFSGAVKANLASCLFAGWDPAGSAFTPTRNTIQGTFSTLFDQMMGYASATNGQLLIGNGAGYTIGTLTAGANAGVTIANGSGTITFSTVQDIRTTANPQFNSLLLSGGIGLGKKSSLNGGLLYLSSTSPAKGTPHPLTLGNTPTSSSTVPTGSPFTKALSMNGTNNYGQAVTSDIAISQTVLSFSLWLRIVATQGSQTGALSISGDHVYLFFDANGTTPRLSADHVSTVITSNTAIGTGVYAHIAGVINTTTQTLYLNGIQVATGNVTPSITAADATVGATSSNTQNISGIFSDVKLWNGYALSPADVLNDLAFGPPAASPCNRWTFNSTSTSTEPDIAPVSPCSIALLVAGDGAYDIIPATTPTGTAFNIWNAGQTAKLFSVTISSGSINLADSANIVCGTSTGTEIGTATTQKIGFWGATPVVQPNITGTSTLTSAGSGTGLKQDSTSTGGIGSTAYTFSDIVKNLKTSGEIAL